MREHDCAACIRTFTWTARTSGCKRGPLNFSTKNLVLKRAKIISIVYLPLTCAIVASLLRCRWLTLDFDSFVHCCASSDSESDENLEGSSSSSSIKDDLCPCSRRSLIRVGTVEDSPGHYLPLWCKADCQTQSLQVVHLIRIFGHGALEKYSKIPRAGECTPW